MTNLVAITVKATDSSDWAKVKAEAAKAGAAAAKAFNDAYKLNARGGGSVSTKDKLESSGGISGDDKSLLNKLKGYANTPGGIGILGTGSDTSLLSALKRQIMQGSQSGGMSLLSGQGAAGMSNEDIIKQVLTGNKPGNVSTKDIIDQVMAGSAPGNVSTKDFISQIMKGSTPGNVTTKDFIDQMMTGVRPGNIDTKDIIHPQVDDTDIAALGKKDGATYGSGFAASLKSKLGSMLGGSGGKGGGGLLSGLLTGGGGSSDAGAAAGALDSGGVAGGALPGIAGVSGMTATITGLAGALVSVLPAITAVASGLGVIGGGFAILELTDKKFAADMSSTMSSIESVFSSAAAPLIKPLEGAATQIAGFFKQIAPDLKEMFGDSAQLIQPLVKGFEGLMSGAGPGFLAMIKTAGPAFVSISQSFSGLGKALGEMFQDFSQASGPSAIVLKAILGLVSSLLPFLGKLGEIFADAIAPAVASFTGALDKVLPAITPLLGIVGQLAGAALTDLAGVLGSVGTLLVDLAPSFTLLAKAAGQVFTALENDGVFASLGNAVEGLAGPIAGLINALVKALLPALPGIIAGFSEFAKLFTGAVVIAVSALADGFTALIKAIPPSVIVALADGFVAVWGAVKLWSIAQGVLNVLLAANPIGIIVVALAAVAGGFYLAWEKSALFRDIIKDIGEVMLSVGIVIVEANRDIVMAFLDMVGAVIDGAAKAFGWVPGLGSKLKGAASAFNGFKTGVGNDFDGIIGKMQSWQGEMSGATSSAKAMSDSIAGDFDNQAKHANTADSALTNYTDDIKKNGVDSDSAKAARQQLITDMTKAGVNAGIAKVDVGDYTTAVKDNGVNSTQAHQARLVLVSDILNASNNAKQGKTDLDTYTTAVKNNGASSSAAKSARQQLITDLEHSGLNAKTATGLVDGLTSSLKKIPSKESTLITASGLGKWAISQTMTSANSPYTSNSSAGDAGISGRAAAGWLVKGGIPGQDSVPILAMPGEAVVPTRLVPGIAPYLAAHGVPGFASGGLVGLAANPSAVYQQTDSKMVAAMQSAMTSSMKSAASAASTAAYSGSYGSGVAQWTSDVLSVLSMLGEPSSLASRVLYQMQTESGGNPNAINNSDSNAAAGDPSRGLLQTIMTTFEAYRSSSLPNDIYNPMANIYAAVNYAMHTYGPSLMSGGMGMGSGHGYSAGGATASGWGIVGEQGRELMKLPGGATVYPHGASQQMLGGGLGPGSGGQLVQLEISGGQSAFDQFMLQWVRENVRSKGGGSVQKAFGRS